MLGNHKNEFPTGKFMFTQLQVRSCSRVADVNTNKPNNTWVQSTLFKTLIKTHLFRIAFNVIVWYVLYVYIVLLFMLNF